MPANFYAQTQNSPEIRLRNICLAIHVSSFLIFRRTHLVGPIYVADFVSPASAWCCAKVITDIKKRTPTQPIK